MSVKLTRRAAPLSQLAAAENKHNGTNYRTFSSFARSKLLKLIADLKRIYLKLLLINTMSKSLHEEEIDRLLDENPSSLEVQRGFSDRLKDSTGQKAVKFCSLLLNIVLVITILFLLRTPERQHTLDCGNSLAEAQQRGCTYDQLTLRWLPETCSRVGLDEYLDASAPVGWKYWLDSEGKMPVHNISMYTNGTALYTTEREHLTHCTYQLIRAADGLRSRGAVDTRARDFAHNHHCATRLLKAAMDTPRLDEITTYVHNAFGTCLVER